MTRTPRVAAVVVTYNSAAPLPGLLETVHAGLAGLEWTLTVVDNDSADDSVLLAEKTLPECRVIRMGRNAGYAAAINAGLADAGDFDAALVLNPDIRLTPGVIATLYAALGDTAAGRTGVTVPRILDEDGHLARSLRRRPTIARALGEALAGQRAGRLAPFGETVLDDEAYRRATRADWATGAIMLISAECLNAAGPWDESFFLYSEETEFALRAADRGYATVLVPSAEVTHLGGESKVSPRLWSLLTVNRVRLYRMRHSAVAAAGYWSAVALREALRAVLGQERSRSALRALIRPSTLELGRR
ncbi:glycosyltransferase family 2 protein [Actinoplanes sp. HUAS TT8]|uniref:glycosyltransferase family 2 protein n=1 Tax=Actinoplanes sp. HUAS TT8 TaxID=3447453 RepID=UPI003F524B0C